MTVYYSDPLAPILLKLHLGPLQWSPNGQINEIAMGPSGAKQIQKQIGVDGLEGPSIPDLSQFYHSSNPLTPIQNLTFGMAVG